MSNERRGRLPTDTVERIRTAVDIVDLVGEYVSLKRSGRNYKGLCPFHTEKTPSFMVGPERQMFYCFGCQKGGDLFTFLMEHDGVSFVEALRLLGQKAGIPVEMEAQRNQKLDAFYQAAEKAAEFYREQLWSAAGAETRRYLQDRGIEPGMAERFRLGSAPDSWEALSTHLSQAGLDTKTLVALGLVASRKSGGTYDVFRRRLMFPITSLSGRVIGLGGRSLPAADEGAPKYLNSADSPIYHKNRVLYGLTESRGAIRRQDSAIITEGYLDYLSLFQAGIENVVAACGTAFGEQQAALLHRYTHRAYILGDNDAAGRRASVRTAGLLLEHGFLVHVVELPAGYDPDSFVREYGAASLETRVREAPGYIAYMKQWVTRRAGDLNVKERVVRHLLDDLRRVSDPLLQELYSKEICKSFALTEATVKHAMQRKSAPAAQAPEPAVVADQVPAAVRQARQGLLRLGLTESAWVERITSELEPADFGSGVERELFEALNESGVDGAWRDYVESSQANSYGSELEIQGPVQGEPERLFNDYRARLIEARIVAAKADLEDRIQEAERRDDRELLKQLVEERQALAQDRSELRRPPSM